MIRKNIASVALFLFSSQKMIHSSLFPDQLQNIFRIFFSDNHLRNFVDALSQNSIVRIGVVGNLFSLMLQTIYHARMTQICGILFLIAHTK